MTDLTPELREKFRRILEPASQAPVAMPALAPVQRAPAPAPQLAATVPTPAPESVSAPAQPELLPGTQPPTFEQSVDGGALEPAQAINIKDRIKLLLEVQAGRAVDPLAPEPDRDPGRAFLESKVKKFEVRNGFLNPINDLTPLNEMDPVSKEVVTRLYNGQTTRTDLSDTEEEYNTKHRLGLSNGIRDMARIMSTSKDWVPAMNRMGWSAINTGTFGIVNRNDSARKEVEHLGEQWLKESDVPEFTGAALGIAAMNGPIARGGEAILGTGAKVLGRFGTYLFGTTRVGQMAKAASLASSSAIEGNAALAVAAGAAKGVVSEGALGGAIGLARDPEPGENRIDNAVHDAKLFAGISMVVRGGIAAKEAVDASKMSKAVSRLAEDLKITEVEAKQMLLQRNPSARTTADLDPKLVEQVKKGKPIESEKINQAILKYSERKQIPLEQASKEVNAKYPGLAMDRKLYEGVGDLEVAADPYKTWLDYLKKPIAEKNGDLVFMPAHRMLEKAGEWLYDAEGLAFGANKLTKIGSVDVRDARRFLFGERSLVKEAYSSAKLGVLQEKRATQEKALKFIEQIPTKVGEIASAEGVSTAAASKRSAQVLEGSVTATKTGFNPAFQPSESSQALKYLGEEYTKITAPLQQELELQGQLGTTRFSPRTRAQVKQLVEEKQVLIDRMMKDVESPAAKKELQKILHSEQFESADQIKDSMKTIMGVKPSINDASELLQKSRYLRSHYQDAGREHLSRFYREHEEGRKAALGFYLKREENTGRINSKIFSERMDLPLEVRKQLGEVEDVTYRAGKTIYNQMDAVFKGKYQQAITMNSDLSLPAKVAGAWDQEAVRRIEQDGWKHIPKNDAAGELSDHVVAPYVYDDLKRAGVLPGQKDGGFLGQVQQGYKKSMQAYKFGKIVYNPSTHFRNMMSNSIMLDMSGMGFLEQGPLLKKSIQEIRSKSEIFAEAQRNGVLDGSIVSEEINALLEHSLRSATNHVEGFQKGFDVAAAPGWFSKANAKLGQVYQSEDQIFKLAKYMHLRGQGFSEAKAAAETQKWLFNYGDIPESVRFAKDYLSPFITYTTKAVPRFFETVIEKPWKLAKYAAYFNAVGNIPAAAQDMQDSKYGLFNTLADFMPDEMKRETYKLSQWRSNSVLPEWAQTNLSAGGIPLKLFSEGTNKKIVESGQTIPRMLRTPFLDKHGRELWMDLTYILPFGDLGENPSQAVIDIPRALFPQHPALDIAQAFKTNLDPFTGQKIANSDEDPMKAQKYMKYIGRTLLPNLAPGGYSWDKIVNAAKSATDYQGRSTTLPVVAMDVILGLKMRPFDIEEQQALRIDEKEKLMGTMTREIEKQAELYSNNMISEDSYISNTDEYLKTIEEIGKKMGVLSNFGKEE